MFLSVFIQKIQAGERVSFNDTMAVIAEHYHYQPTEFQNGFAADALSSPAGTNEGSCKIFAFAKLQQLDQQQTLGLFGDYYWQDVLGNPTGTDHRNIRLFMQHGWAGIAFKGAALTPK